MDSSDTDFCHGNSTPILVVVGEISDEALSSIPGKSMPNKFAYLCPPSARESGFKAHLVSGGAAMCRRQW